MRVLVIISLVVVGTAAESFYRLPTPFTYTCKKSLCVKEDRIQTGESRSLGECQLTCGQFGSLWPQPTGEVKLSGDVVHFDPYNMKVTRIATTDKKVGAMVDEASRYFKRNVHFLHPDFPASQKTPYTSDQMASFDDANQQFRRKFSNVQQETEFSSNNFNQQANSEFQSFDQENFENWERYSPFLNQKYNAGVEKQNINIEFTVTSPEEKLTLDTDESYNLVVQTVDDQTTVTILATTYYGARHALESLSQLIAYDENSESLMMVREVKLQDQPQFKYRGLMLDTGRNFYTKDELMTLLDSMSQNKMNVFHWHITDAASFPMYSNRLPQMAYYGSYSPRKVYYPEDIQELVQYAKLRGIIVVPELDAPAHTSAGWEWGEKEGKGKLVLCTGSDKASEPWFSVSKEPPSGQLNPVNPEVYPVLGELYRDMLDYFDPEMLHMGGDDVSFKCWQNSEEIKEYLAANNREANSREYFELWNTFQSNAYSKLREASKDRKVTPIIHSSSFARNYIDKEAYIIQLNENSDEAIISDYVTNGFKVIFSNPDQWRLDCVGSSWVGEKSETCPGVTLTWRNFYDNSPLDMLYNLGVTNARTSLPEQQAQQQTTADGVPNPRDYVLGGTASMWSFETDGNGVQSKVWPKVSAMAERLWSDPAEPSNFEVDTTQKRLNVQRLRMARRGFRVDPTQPEFCIHDESSCYSKDQYERRSENVPQ